MQLVHLTQHKPIKILHGYILAGLCSPSFFLNLSHTYGRGCSSWADAVNSFAYCRKPVPILNETHTEESLPLQQVNECSSHLAIIVFCWRYSPVPHRFMTLLVVLQRYWPLTEAEGQLWATVAFAFNFSHPRSLCVDDISSELTINQYLLFLKSCLMSDSDDTLHCYLLFSCQKQLITTWIDGGKYPILVGFALLSVCALLYLAEAVLSVPFDKVAVFVSHYVSVPVFTPVTWSWKLSWLLWS